MKRLRLGLLLMATALVVPSAVMAQDAGSRQGWYASLGAGLNILRDSDIDGGPFQSKAEFNNGFAGRAAAGYSFGSIRVEGEYSYRRNGVDSLSNPAGSGDGHVSSNALMANAYYDFLNSSNWTPYLGVGIGAARVNWSDVRGPGPVLFDGSNYQFAYQGIAGVSYAFNPNWSVEADYRYFATLDPRIDSTKQSVPATGSASTEYGNHTIMVGFTYHFGAPAPKAMPVAQPAPPPPPPPAAPPPPPAPKAAAPEPSVYIVFFAFDKADINPVAAQVLDRAIADFNKSGSVKFDVQGHADRSGSEQYNEKLSQRRAVAVAKYLTSHGVKASEISSEWFGETHPRVPTADGERNDQNRRAEIFLKK